MSRAFTLIELLVVIAIIAILSVVVILTLNPAQLLEQSRDSNRLSDMTSLNEAIGIYLAQGGTSLGSSNVVYVSLPDPAATSTSGDQCQGLGLISLPATYSYHCAASSTYRMTNGTGWIPVNFASLAAPPLGALPTDPVNTSSSRLYYTYDTNGSQYEVTSVMESQKYGIGGSNDVITPDGGILASVYEKGTATGLEPLDYGDSSLVGWWNFSEGTGTIAYDYSGNNATGSWSGTLGNQYVAGQIGAYAANLSSSQITVPSSASLSLTTQGTVSFWMFPYSSGSCAHPLSKYGNTGEADYIPYFGGPICNGYSTPTIQFDANAGGTWQSVSAQISNINLNAWSMIVWTYTSSGGSSIYLNGVFDGSTPAAGLLYSNTVPLLIGSLPGLLDDVRVYNRALTAAQVAAMYAGGK